MLRFRLFGIPVRVEFSFLLIGLLGWPAFTGVEIVAWVAAAFVAILLHELGHALTARRAGADVAITLHAFGGVTSWSTPGTIPSGRRFLVAAAGSTVGMMVAALTVVVIAGSSFGSWSEFIDALAAPDGRFQALPDFGQAFLLGFWWASFVWGLLNWLPIRALDGGHMLAAFLTKVAPRRAESIARIVGIVTGVGVALIALRYGQWLAAILAVALTLPELSRPSTPQARDVVRQPTAADRDDEEFPI